MALGLGTVKAFCFYPAPTYALSTPVSVVQKSGDVLDGRLCAQHGRGHFLLHRVLAGTAAGDRHCRGRRRVWPRSGAGRNRRPVAGPDWPRRRIGGARADQKRQRTGQRTVGRRHQLGCVAGRRHYGICRVAKRARPHLARARESQAQRPVGGAARPGAVVRIDHGGGVFADGVVVGQRWHFGHGQLGQRPASRLGAAAAGHQHGAVTGHHHRAVCHDFSFHALGADCLERCLGGRGRYVRAV